MITLRSADNLQRFLTLAVVAIMAGRALPSTFTVANTSDTGEGSLRWAIEQANDNLGPDYIEFDIEGTGPHTIQPGAPLPELNEEVVIDGYSQLGSEPATDMSNAVLKIVLDGSYSGSEHLGLLSLDPGASDCRITGLVISNYDRNGIFIESGASGNIIEGNYIEGNHECGIFIKSANNVIGGTTPAARNVISANDWGGITIYGVEASGNKVLGNFIGTDVSGTYQVPNGGFAVGINDAPDNVVGGTTLGSRNVITNVSIVNPDAVNNRIIGNYIGVNASGEGVLDQVDEFNYSIGALIDAASYNVIGPGNVISGHARGVVIWAATSYNSVRDNYIGTDATGEALVGTYGNYWDGVTVNGSHNRIEGNVVSSSGSNGIYVEQPKDATTSHNTIADNIVGMNASGDSPVPNQHGVTINTAVNTTVSGNLIAGNSSTGVTVANDLPWNPGVDFAIGNHITQNAIYDNGTEGINLVPYDDPDGVTPNDEGDVDTGPNNLMNFPVLTSAMATPGQLIVTGTIDTPRLLSVTLEFFANHAPDGSGYGEGEMYVGAARPNATGRFVAALTPVPPGMWISATATDGDGNTSEFALSIEAVGPGNQ